MTHLVLILGINGAGLVFAGLLARWLLSRDAGSSHARRLGGAIDRAIGSFLRSEYRLVALAALGLCAALFALQGALLAAGRPLASVKSAFWMALGVTAGAATLCAVVHLCTKVALRASLCALSAAQRSIDRALAIAARAGAVAGLSAETASVLGVAGFFALVFAMKGGVSAPRAVAAAQSFETAVLTTGFALGAAVAALVLQRAGTLYHAATDVGGDLAGERDAGLDHDDPRNPAVVSGLTGDHVGALAARTADLFVSATVANVVALILGARAFSAQSGESQILVLMGLPLVVRALGLIASGFGVMVVRTNELENPARGLWRGHATTLIVALGGLVGATMWLVPDAWLKLSLAGGIAVVLAVSAAHLARLRLSRRSSPIRDVVDGYRFGEAPGLAHGIGLGLEGTWLPVVTTALALISAWGLGASTGLAHGGLFGVLIAVSSMLAIGPYVLALGASGAIADNAAGVAAMQPSAPEAGVRRANRLDEAGFSATAVSQNYLILVSSVSAVLVALTLPLLVEGTGGVDLANPIVAMSGVLGGAAVLAYMGSMMRGSARGARGVALEVERQLRSFPREGGVAIVPREYTPSYRACVDVVARSSLEGALTPVALGLILPVVLGVGLSLMYRSADPRLAAQGLASFVVVAASTGLLAALAIDAARTALSQARRLTRPRGTTASLGASIGGDALGDILGNAAGPAAPLLVKAAAIASLAVVPFLN